MIGGTSTINVHMSCSNKDGNHGLDVPPGQVCLVCFSVTFIGDKRGKIIFCIELKGPDKDEKNNPKPNTADSATTAAAKASAAASAAGVACDVKVEDAIEDFSISFVNAKEIDGASTYGKVSFSFWTFMEPPKSGGSGGGVKIDPPPKPPRVGDVPDPGTGGVPRTPPGTDPGHRGWQDELDEGDRDRGKEKKKKEETQKMIGYGPTGSMVLATGFPASGPPEMKEIWFAYVYSTPEDQAAELARALGSAGIESRVRGSLVEPMFVQATRAPVILLGLRVPPPSGLQFPPPGPWHWTFELPMTYSAQRFDPSTNTPTVSQLPNFAPLSRFNGTLLTPRQVQRDYNRSLKSAVHSTSIKPSPSVAAATSVAPATKLPNDNCDCPRQ